jgi:hypothetical protein
MPKIERLENQILYVINNHKKSKLQRWTWPVSCSQQHGVKVKANGSYSTEFKTVPADKQLKKTDGKTDRCKNECPVASQWGNKGVDYFVITSTIQYWQRGNQWSLLVITGYDNDMTTHVSHAIFANCCAEVNRFHYYHLGKLHNIQKSRVRHISSGSFYYWRNLNQRYSQDIIIT